MSLRRATPLIALVVVLALSACETMKGAGRDLQGAGQTVTQSADQVQGDM